MKKLIAISLLILTITPCLRAQKKEIAQARSYIKSGKNLDKAEKLMAGLLEKDSLNRENPKIHVLLYQAVQRQYEVGNEKLYLGEKYDTATLFNLTRRMFEICERFDSIDARPDKKGRVHPEYRRKHAGELDLIRRNLYLGGRFCMNRNRFAEAFEFFDAYLDCARQPLFADYHYAERDTMMKHVAYWAGYAGLKETVPQHILKYADLALTDTATAVYTLQYMVEACHMLGDDELYLQTLKQGFSQYMENIYFYPRLMDYYNSHQQYEEALATSERALAVNPYSELFLFGKSTVLLNMGRNEESLETSQQLIGINNTLAEPYFNAATAILNQIIPLEQNALSNKTSIRKLYQQARPYMERYRKLAPRQQDKWAPALYKIYFNLNLGKQFDEIDKLLKK